MIYRWKIFLAELNPVRGSEQGKTRPVLHNSIRKSQAIFKEI